MSDSSPIPNIDIGEVYDQRYADAEVHYDALGRMADFFGHNSPAHRHDRFFQVHYVKSGMVRGYLDERQFHQRAPMFFLTPPTVTHAFVIEEGCDGHVLTVRQQLVWDLLEESGELGDVHAVSPLCVATGRLGGRHSAEVARVEMLFEELRREFDEDRPGRALAMQTLTRLIFISLFRLASHALPAQPVRHEDLAVFQRFQMLIEDHFPHHWVLTQYADALGVTENRLNEICRRTAGKPSKRLVIDRLMQEARRLLIFTTASVNEIGYQLGFNDPAYFSRFFTREAGVTPGRYRSSNRGS
ncbi:4-hydroxyphenylacetate catabolism regulatory protein HpaA [Halomonas organivorans]|uniref:AraC family 4-hydroxyphenylacetate 3-monooxygenase operon regulatory protein n=1 Tax=Halomonas organivorans TaxID=257772 RepID=A0A7W5BYC2_9GAMM|nr:4-hydroxyphenylacetate catabolism regulatory protein HpaA [Halomonas organivorans]MBB3141432.1 AraC family 4-hydroxyphenylacetate 3-monooxygenase operon regulatory protein [Halomonas organivorans]